MSRSEIYPWSLLVEVGDYFAVPTEMKPFSYMSALVSQRNYKNTKIKFSATRTTYGTIVMVAQVGEEPPPYDYKSADGIMAIEGKRKLRSQDHNTPLGDRPNMPPRSVKQIVASMSPETREANLPWWTDPRTGKLVFNSKVATPEDLEKWYRGEKLPEHYPDYYDLDSSLIKRTPEAEEEQEEDFFEVLEEEGEGQAN